MRRVMTLVLLAVGMSLAAPETSDAQWPQRPGRPQGLSFLPPDETPETEVGVHLGIWAPIEGGGEFGVRITRNRNEWFGLEYGFSYRPGAPGPGGAPAGGLGIVNARFSAPHPTRPGVLFLTLGAVVGSSQSFAASPVIGAGVQVGRPETWARFRMELQIFTRGRSGADRGRLMFGFVMPF